MRRRRRRRKRRGRGMGEKEIKKRGRGDLATGRRARDRERKSPTDIHNIVRQKGRRRKEKRIERGQKMRARNEKC